MKTARLSKALVIFSIFAFTLLMSSVAFAQTGTSSLRGTITDLQGRAVAGAQVTITNEEKNFTRTQATNEDGAYTFTSIPPGSYRLEVEANRGPHEQIFDRQVSNRGQFDRANAGVEAGGDGDDGFAHAAGAPVLKGAMSITKR